MGEVLQANLDTRRRDEGDSRTPKKVEKRPREPMTVIMIQHTPGAPKPGREGKEWLRVDSG